MEKPNPRFVGLTLKVLDRCSSCSFPIPVRLNGTGDGATQISSATDADGCITMTVECTNDIPTSMAVLEVNFLRA